MTAITNDETLEFPLEATGWIGQRGIVDMSPQRFLIEGGRCASVPRYHGSLEFVLLHAEKSAMEGYLELHQPTTKVLESRRQVEVSKVQMEGFLEGRKFHV